MSNVNIGFSVIINTSNADDVQKLAQIMQVFADQSTTVDNILISKAVQWQVDNAAQRSDAVPPAFAAPYGESPVADAL
ncbi:hypothetical protein [Pectobacterium phage CX5]|uniref:Uncharacterized protein n=1 Tax=Pectobacterium phage CX5 TaxID=2652426 RepID=A0A5P8D4L7_9CAUD|nr:hypothetical protein [Pectobacterium phage CX5]QFP93616.1 hypothetical protein [Pectobacterium phage CX5-1]